MKSKMETGKKAIVYHPESCCFVAVGTIVKIFNSGDIYFVVEGKIPNSISFHDMNECDVILEEDAEYQGYMQVFLAGNIL